MGDINKDETEELKCSVWDAFDQMQLCYTFLAQMKSYYRYGTTKDCTPHRKHLARCWSLRFKSKEEVRDIMMEYHREKQLRKTINRPSADIWEVSFIQFLSVLFCQMSCIANCLQSDKIIQDVE